MWGHSEPWGVECPEATTCPGQRPLGVLRLYSLGTCETWAGLSDRGEAPCIGARPCPSHAGVSPARRTSACRQQAGHQTAGEDVLTAGTDAAPHLLGSHISERCQAVLPLPATASLASGLSLKLQILPVLHYGYPPALGVNESPGMGPAEVQACQLPAPTGSWRNLRTEPCYSPGSLLRNAPALPPFVFPGPPSK